MIRRLLPFALLCTAALHAQDAHTRVVFSGPQQAVVHANAADTVELKFAILPGFHINSHKPRQNDLIATSLALVEPDGVVVRAVDFPDGEQYAFDFDPDTKLSVYSGELTLAVHVRATPGEHHLLGKLHYQACDNRTCFPPKDLPLDVTLTAK